MPTVSVILPNYNHARFLRRRIEGIFAQTFGDFELILMDDASRDDSRSILAEYESRANVRAIYNSFNSGSTFKQWNKGIAAATGKYIWLAESDDDADPRLLERLVNQLEEHPNCGIAYCQSWEIDELDRRQRTLKFWTDDLDPARWETDFVADGRQECARYLIYKNTLPNASAILFRRELYNDVGGADERMRLCGDWMLWTRMLMAMDLAFIAEPLNFFRKHGQSVRSGGARNGLYIEETYRVVSFILGQVSVPKRIADDAAKRLSHLAFDFLDHDLPLWRLACIQRFARRIDPGMGRKIWSVILRPRLGAWRQRVCHPAIGGTP